MDNYCDSEAFGYLFFQVLLVLLACFLSCVSMLHSLLLDVYIYICVKHALSFALRDVFISASDYNLSASFLYACVYTAASLCCYIWFRAWYDSEQMAAFFQRTMTAEES